MFLHVTRLWFPDYYVLFCLQSFQQKINTAAAKAQHYLESQIASVTDDYVLAIASYALKLAKSTSFTTAFAKLNNDTIVRGIGIFISMMKCKWLKKAPVIKSAFNKLANYPFSTAEDSNDTSQLHRLIRWLTAYTCKE